MADGNRDGADATDAPAMASRARKNIRARRWLHCKAADRAGKPHTPPAEWEAEDRREHPDDWAARDAAEPSRDGPEQAARRIRNRRHAYAARRRKAKLHVAPVAHWAREDRAAFPADWAVAPAPNKNGMPTRVAAPRVLHARAAATLHARSGRSAANTREALFVARERISLRQLRRWIRTGSPDGLGYSIAGLPHWSDPQDGD